MKQYLPILLWPMMLLYFVSGSIAVADEVPPTFILVDHSESMRGDLTETQEDLSYYLRNVASDDLVSITYFGGSNGGDCRSDVTVEGPVRKAELSEPADRGLADGDNPMLGAIDSVRALHGPKSARIIIISDFDAACGATHSACMAVTAYKKENPNWDFKFEHVGEDEPGTELYRCLKGLQGENKPYKFPKIEIDLSIADSDETVADLRPPDYDAWILIASWVVSIAFIGLLMIDAALLLTWFQVSTDDTDEANLDEKNEGRERPTLKTISSVAAWATGIAAIILLVLLIFTFKAIAWVWGAIHYWANLRFGAALFSTVLAGYLAWTAFTLWNAGMKRLSNSWIKNFNSLRAKTDADAILGVLNSLDNSRTRELNSWSNKIRDVEAELDEETRREASEKLLIATADVGSVYDVLKERVDSKNYDSFREIGFDDVRGLLGVARRERLLDKANARRLRNRFLDWERFFLPCQTKPSSPAMSLVRSPNKSGYPSS